MLEVHNWMWMLVAGDLEVAVTPSVMLADASIFGRIWCPSRAGEKFEGMDSFLIMQRQAVDSDHNDPLRARRVVFTDVSDAPGD